MRGGRRHSAGDRYGGRLYGGNDHFAAGYNGDEHRGLFGYFLRIDHGGLNDNGKASLPHREHRINGCAQSDTDYSDVIHSGLFCMAPSDG